MRAVAKLLDTLATSAACIQPSFDVALWRIELARLPDDLVTDAVSLRWLDTIEIETLARIADRRVRAAFAVRRLLRRMIVAAHSGCSPADVRIEVTCPFCGSAAHGPPSISGRGLEGFRLSTSSTAHAALIAVGKIPVGVDVEDASRSEFRSLANNERSGLQTFRLVADAIGPAARPIDAWVALEAMTKGLGLGLTASPRHVAVALTSWHFTWIRHDLGTTACLASAVKDPAVVSLLI